MSDPPARRFSRQSAGGRTNQGMSMGGGRMDRRPVVTVLALGLIISAQPHAALAAELQEVIVTAQKREQSLQEVSAPVTALGGERLQNAHIDNLGDLQLIVPSITFGTDFNIAKVF